MVAPFVAKDARSVFQRLAPPQPLKKIKIVQIEQPKPKKVDPEEQKDITRDDFLLK